MAPRPVPLVYAGLVAAPFTVALTVGGVPVWLAAPLALAATVAAALRLRGTLPAELADVWVAHPRAAWSGSRSPSSPSPSP
jgi:hypothetical protein